MLTWERNYSLVINHYRYFQRHVGEKIKYDLILK